MHLKTEFSIQYLYLGKDEEKSINSPLKSLLKKKGLGIRKIKKRVRGVKGSRSQVIGLRKD